MSAILPGRFVAVEGIDGAGKSTLVARLAADLRARGISVRVVRRYMVPALTRLWERLVEADAVDQHEAAALAAADTRIGLERLVRPALAAGEVVLADRSYLSHQVHFALRGVSRARLVAWFQGLPAPDLVLYLDLPVERALERLRAGDKPDFWECGLDARLGLSVGRAWRHVREHPLDPAALAGHFRAHQEAARELFREILPPGATVTLDGALPPEALAAAAARLVAGAGVGYNGGHDAGEPAAHA